MDVQLYMLVTYLVQIAACSKLTALNSDINIEKGKTALLTWNVKSDLVDADRSVSCYHAEADTPEIIHGKALGDSTFAFDVTTEGSNIYGRRITVGKKASNLTKLWTVFAISIANVTFTDDNIFMCKYGHHESKIRLQVRSKLVIRQPGFPMSVSVKRSNGTNISVQLCSKPKPYIKWQYRQKTWTTHGFQLKDEYCYQHTYTIEVKGQEDCGSVISYEVTSYDRKLSGSIKVKVNVHVVKPMKVLLSLTTAQCTQVTWVGPNIGSCVAPLTYEINLTKHSNVIQSLHTSSNIIHICTVNVLKEKSYDVSVRTVLYNTTSEWTKAIATADDSKLRTSKGRNLIIVCSIIGACLLLGLTIPFLYCFYRNRRQANKKQRKVSKNDEDSVGGIRYTSLGALNDSDKQHDVFYTEAKDLEHNSKLNDIFYTETGELVDKANGSDSCFYTEAKDLESKRNTPLLNAGTDTYQVMTSPPIDNVTPTRKYSRRISCNSDIKSTQDNNDMLNARKLKHSFSLDNYDVADRNRFSSDVANRSRYRSNTSAEVETQLIYDVPDTTKRRSSTNISPHAIYDVIPRSKTLDNALKINTKPFVHATNENNASVLNGVESHESLYAVPTALPAVEPDAQLKKEKRVQRTNDKIYENV